eukprot:11475210-Alexandrium_andersonii.AAC.1
MDSSATARKPSTTSASSAAMKHPPPTQPITRPSSQKGGRSERLPCHATRVPPKRSRPVRPDEVLHGHLQP